MEPVLLKYGELALKIIRGYTDIILQCSYLPLIPGRIGPTFNYASFTATANWHFSLP